MSAQWSDTEKERAREGKKNVLTRIWRNEPFNWFGTVLNNGHHLKCHSNVTFI